LLASNSGASAGAYLDVAQAAVLKGDYKAGQEWLSAAMQRSTTSRDKALCYFYQLWIAINLGQTNEYKVDFDSWRDATRQLREEKTGLEWTFVGAKKSLDISKTQMGKDKTQLLTSMINVLEDDNLPLLSWPEKGVQ
jgi:hypothetical protein